MSGETVKQAILVSQDAINPNLALEQLAIFDTDGSLLNPGATGATGAAGADGLDGIAAVATTATAIGTAAKTTTAAEPASGQIVGIKFTNGNSAASPTVNFNGAGARTVLLGGTAPTGAECAIAANGMGFFFFDGTYLHQLGAYT